jgi:Zn-ribbon protein, possibly nucleic acid-binding
MEKNNEVTNQNLLRDEADVTVERRLIALYRLQQIDSQIDKIRIVRGELPLEVQDLEDEVAGLETRIKNFEAEETLLEGNISTKKTTITDAKAAIAKYEAQQKNVKNNREYESLSKEIEFQELEIQLCEKKIKEFTFDLDKHKNEIEKTKTLKKEKEGDLDIKKNELDDIVKETEETEQKLLEQSHQDEKLIDERYLSAYHKIRNNARNGLAVVTVDNSACGGCFNIIPHQRQMDIKMHKKIIVCEYCGRILVDDTIAAEVDGPKPVEQDEEKPKKKATKKATTKKTTTKKAVSAKTTETKEE